MRKHPPRYVFSILSKVVAGLIICVNTVYAQEAAECSTDKLGAFSPLFLDSYDRRLDYSCFTHTFGSEKAEHIPVDIRHPADYQRATISGAINIPLNQLRHKKQFKRKKLLIFNNGFDISDLAYACDVLKKSGFADVQALTGGVAGWKLMGGDVAGQNTGLNEMRTITGKSLLKELLSGSIHRVIRVGNEGAAEPGSRLMEGYINYVEPARLTGMLAKISMERDQALEWKPIVVIDDSPKGDSKDKLFNVYHLEGGSESFDVFHKQWLVMNKSRKSKRTDLKCF